MNRPPKPEEVCEHYKQETFDHWGIYDGFERRYHDEEHFNEMQEALTAEWLIDQGLMPDPTDFSDWWIDCNLDGVPIESRALILNEWVCYDESEDKTK